MNNDNIVQPFSEVDVPPENRVASQRTASIPSKKLDRKHVENIEKVSQIARKNFITKSGLKLLIYILSAMLVLIILDTIIVNYGLDSSEHLTTIIDFGKYTATILLGYLFSSKASEHD